MSVTGLKFQVFPCAYEAAQVQCPHWGKRGSSAALQECEPWGRKGMGCESPGPARKRYAEMRLIGTLWDSPWRGCDGRRGWGLHCSACRKVLSVDKFLWEGAGEMEPGVPSDRAGGNGHPWKFKKSCLSTGRFLLWGCWDTVSVCLGSLHLWAHSELGAGTGPVLGGAWLDMSRGPFWPQLFCDCLRKCTSVQARGHPLWSLCEAPFQAVWQKLFRWCLLDVAVYVQVERVHDSPIPYLKYLLMAHLKLA